MDHCVFIFLNSQTFIIEREVRAERKDWKIQACLNDFTHQREESRTQGKKCNRATDFKE